MKTRVLIVDDHQVYRDGLKVVINHQSRHGSGRGGGRR